MMQTDRFHYLLQDLSAPFASYKGGIGSVEYSQADVVVHLAANVKVHQLVQEPHRATENIQITYNVLEYCRQNEVLLIFSNSREVYGDIRRYIADEQQADFAFTESTYSLPPRSQGRPLSTPMPAVTGCGISCSASAMSVGATTTTSSAWNGSFLSSAG